MCRMVKELPLLKFFFPSLLQDVLDGESHHLRSSQESATVDDECVQEPSHSFISDRRIRSLISSENPAVVPAKYCNCLTDRFRKTICDMGSTAKFTVQSYGMTYIIVHCQVMTDVPQEQTGRRQVETREIKSTDIITPEKDPVTVTSGAAAMKSAVSRKVLQGGSPDGQLDETENSVTPGTSPQQVDKAGEEKPSEVKSTINRDEYTTDLKPVSKM